MKLSNKIGTVLVALSLSACASYQFGDLSKRYCNEQKPEIKRSLKALLEINGVEVPLDYCTARNAIFGG